MKLPPFLTTVTPLSKSLALLLFIALPFVGFMLGYKYHQAITPQSKIVYRRDPSPMPTDTVAPEAINDPTARPTVTSTPIVAVKTIKDLKYTLPSNWTAKINNNNLFLSPLSGGGYLSINTYKYSADLGRREYYCQLVGYCIPETYFTEMKLGNISGYEANALDNSGGSDYFGAKDSNFYIIRSYGPPSPNDFDTSYQQVLNSLKF